jgi:hypothetical protein
MDTLADIAEAGYCTAGWKLYQQGKCGTYAVGLLGLRPGLRLGVAGHTENGAGDASEGWSPAHYFAHDDVHAWDSAGQHDLPYLGVHGDMDYFELDQEPAWWGLPDDEGSGPAEIARAQAHAREHGILNGRYATQIS